MAGFVPFNRRNNSLVRTGFDDFHNMLDDFFSDNWLPERSLLRDTFKIDIQETENEYCIEAELPGVKKEEIDLDIKENNLCISVNRNEEINKDGKNYIHRERRSSSMSRRIRLADAKMDETKAKLDDGILTITIPKDTKVSDSLKIEIDD
ncbi:MAG: Hsp20 family protein [Ruminococcaceae bacterium]|nr:Hsp20 family protein [Oscillospiraceae bacterium]